MASLAFLGATAVTETTGPSCESCAEGEVCRFGISSDGQSCTTEGVCVEKVTHGAFCSEVEADKSCFSGTCADGLVCLPRTAQPASVQGICVATCKVGDKVVAKEGEVVPGAGDKWCNRLYCNGEGDLVAYGETKPQCPVAKDLRCCAGEPERKKKKHACCGAAGLWVRRRDDGTYECDGVVSPVVDDTTPDDQDVRLTPVAPFAHGCLDACGKGMDEGWTGLSPEREQFCNTCRCIRRELVCTGLDCSGKMKCCALEDMDDYSQKCCGATGKWVTPNDDGKYLCAGQLYKAKKAKGAPFAEVCVTSCAVGDETIESGESIRHPEPTQWCNQCACNKGVLTCANEQCVRLEDLKCCPPTTKPDEDHVCCGITGTWVKAGLGVTCGTQPVGLAGFAPITWPCRDMCRPSTAAAGGPSEDVVLGWTGSKVGGTFCDTCSCNLATTHEVCEDKTLSNGDPWRPVKDKWPTSAARIS